MFKNSFNWKTIILITLIFYFRGKQYPKSGLATYERLRMHKLKKRDGQPGYRHSMRVRGAQWIPPSQNWKILEKSLVTLMWARVGGWLASRLIADESAELDLYDDENYDDPYRARFITRWAAGFPDSEGVFLSPSRRCVDLGAPKINTRYRGTCSETMMISLYNRKRFISLGRTPKSDWGCRSVGHSTDRGEFSMHNQSALLWAAVHVHLLYSTLLGLCHNSWLINGARSECIRVLHAIPNSSYSPTEWQPPGRGQKLHMRKEKRMKRTASHFYLRRSQQVNGWQSAFSFHLGRRNIKGLVDHWIICNWGRWVQFWGQPRHQRSFGGQ